MEKLVQMVAQMEQANKDALATTMKVNELTTKFNTDMKL